MYNTSIHSDLTGAGVETIIFQFSKRIIFFFSSSERGNLARNLVVNVRLLRRMKRVEKKIIL